MSNTNIQQPKNTAKDSTATMIAFAQQIDATTTTTTKPTTDGIFVVLIPTDTQQKKKNLQLQFFIHRREDNGNNDEQQSLLLQLFVRNVYTDSDICDDLKMDRQGILAARQQDDEEQHSNDKNDDSRTRHYNSNDNNEECSLEMGYLLQLLRSSSTTNNTSTSRKQHGQRELAVDLALKEQSSNDSMDTNSSNYCTVSVKERLKSGMVRLLWSVRLQNTRRPDGASSTSPPPPSLSLLDLSLCMLNRQEQLKQELLQLQQQHGNLEQARDDWKDTAQKLERTVWEEEKAQLMHNFCELYQGQQQYAKSEVESLRRQVQNLKQELSKATAAAASSSSNIHHRIIHPPLPEALQNVPDDNDQEIWDPEVVDKLAKGNKGRRKRPPPQPAAKQPPPPARRKRAKEEKREKKTPIDNKVSNIATAELPKRVPVKREKLEDDGSSSTSVDLDQKADRVTVKKEPPDHEIKTEPSEPDNNTDSNSKPSGMAALEKFIGDSSDSDDDDDNMYVDRSMEAKIMADLAAYKADDDS